jgi:hypothetical protein
MAPHMFRLSLTPFPGLRSNRISDNGTMCRTGNATVKQRLALVAPANAPAYVLRGAA